MNPATINPFSLPSVALEERASLPTTPCIYFAIDAHDTVQYIGQTVNLMQRWACHHRYAELARMGSIRLSWLECNDVELLREIELILIDSYNPPLNGCRVIPARKGNGIKLLHCQLSVLIAKRNLELAQEGKQLSQRALARELEISLTTVNKLYNGRPLTARIDPETVEKICEYFQCAIEDLFVLREDKTESLSN